MGRGVIKAQVSSRSSCTAGRSAAEADETIAATHAKTKETVRKRFPRILLLSPPLLVARKRMPLRPRVFRFGRSLLIYIKDDWGNRLRVSEGRSELGRSSRRQTDGGSQMSLWLIPMIYAAASFLGGITLPRLEQAYFPYGSGISVASAQAFLSAVASGMIALTGIVFTVGLVMVQFSAIAYSPNSFSFWLATRSCFIRWVCSSPRLFTLFPFCSMLIAMGPGSCR